MPDRRKKNAPASVCPNERLGLRFSSCPAFPSVAFPSVPADDALGTSQHTSSARPFVLAPFDHAPPHPPRCTTSRRAAHCRAGDEVPVDKLESLKKLPAFIGEELILHDEYEGTGNDNDAGEFHADEVYTKSFISDKGFFTAEELVDCIVEFEKIRRNSKTGEGCVDTEHVFLEGFGEHYSFPGRYIPYWS